MEANRTPCTEDNPNIKMLHEIVSRLDPGRAFLPTSASGPSEFISSTPGNSHDVHGWWQYQGNPGQYKFFGGSDSLFHSEFGCDGMSSLASLKKILPSEELRPVACLLYTSFSAFAAVHQKRYRNCWYWKRLPLFHCPK